MTVRFLKKKLSLLILLIPSLVKGQAIMNAEYYSAIGLTGGFVMGGTFKGFIKRKSAIELFGVTKYKGAVYTLLIERHLRVFPNRQYSLFIGGGLHGGYYNYEIYTKKSKVSPASSKYTFRSGNKIYNGGVDMVFGLEYYAGIYPLSVCVAIKPTLDPFASNGRTW